MERHIYFLQNKDYVAPTMNFPSARFISLEKSKQQGFWRQRQRRDLAPAQAIGLGLGKADHPSPERAAQTKTATENSDESIIRPRASLRNRVSKSRSAWGSTKAACHFFTGS